jgi:hypothetical protein
VQEAINTGALTHVHEASVESEILPAAEGMLREERIVSSNIKEYELTDPLSAIAPHRDEVLFYFDDATRS